MKALIVYGTRYGATAGTSEEIGKVLREEGFDVRIVNSTKEKVKDITEYQLIVVGSGIKMGKWIKEPEQFLNNFQKEITTKKVAIFISSAIQAIYEHEGNIEEMEKAWKKNLEEKASKYALNPVNMAIFGGVFHYDDMGWMTKKTVGQLWRKFENAGFEKKDGTYDTRDWDVIRVWTKELAQKARA